MHLLQQTSNNWPLYFAVTVLVKQSVSAVILFVYICFCGTKHPHIEVFAFRLEPSVSTSHILSCDFISTQKNKNEAFQARSDIYDAAADSEAPAVTHVEERSGLSCSRAPRSLQWINRDGGSDLDT